MTLFIAVSSFLVAFALATEYGVDCSFPIHGTDFRCPDKAFGNARKQFYQDFMEGCHIYHGRKASRCDDTERWRIAMNRRQPQSMFNYTSTGFKKIRAPKEVMELLTTHWQRNKANMQPEVWAAGSTIVNHWESPTYMVSVENTKLRGAGNGLKASIWNAAKTTIEQWTGMELQPTSMYGVRMYTEGAVLNPHADRLPLVSSCIINVDQDVDEPWPLEVYDREGRAVNVTMNPGDMVLYESGSLVHGRPFPLKGRYYANIFIHFEPTGRPLGDTTGAYLDTLDDFLPPYIVDGTPEVEHWTQGNPHGWQKPAPSPPIQQIQAPEGHNAAALGDLERLQALAKTDKRALNKKDENGWRPIHEAVRGGHTDAVKLLIANGAHKDARTGRQGEGFSPLNLALVTHGEDHPIIDYLRSIGAQDIGLGEL